MNDSEKFDSPPAVGPDPKNLQEQQEVLRKLFLSTLVAVLIMSGSLTVFLIRQVMFVRRDLESVRPQIEQLVKNYQQIEEPQINSFINTLVNFSRTHPEFNPVLAKYKIAPAIAAPVTPTGVATTPAKK